MVLICVVLCVTAIIGYGVIVRGLFTMLIDRTKKHSELVAKIVASNKANGELNELLQSLEEGIVVIKDGKLDFNNDLFKSILHRVEPHNSSDPLQA